MKEMNDFKLELFKITDSLKRAKSDNRDLLKFMNEQEESCGNRLGIYIINCLQYFREDIDLRITDSYGFNGKPDIPMEDFRYLTQASNILTKIENSIIYKP